MKMFVVAVIVLIFVLGSTSCSDDLDDLRVINESEVQLDDTGGSSSGGGSTNCPDCRGTN